MVLNINREVLQAAREESSKFLKWLDDEVEQVLTDLVKVNGMAKPIVNGAYTLVAGQRGAMLEGFGNNLFALDNVANEYLVAGLSRSEIARQILIDPDAIDRFVGYWSAIKKALKETIEERPRIVLPN